MDSDLSIYPSPSSPSLPSLPSPDDSPSPPTPSSTDDLLTQIDKTQEDHYKAWTGSILFSFDINATAALSPSSKLTSLDICSLIGKKKKLANDIYYFDRFKYPPPAPGTKKIPPKDRVFELLKNDLRKASIEHGSPVLANGSDKNGDRIFKCSNCHRLYKRKSQTTSCEGDYRVDSIVNSDKKGRRKSGRSLPRRTSTQRAKEKDKVCQFSFQVAWNGTGYYLKQTSGSSTHKHHPKIRPDLIPVPTSLIPKEERENLMAMADGCLGAAVGRNFLHSKLGKYISSAKIAYIQNSSKATFKDKDVPCSDLDDLLNFLKNSNEVRKL